MAVKSPGYGRKGDKGDKGDPGDKGGPGAASTVPGPAGKSAYEVAVAAGFTGAQVEWLASLKVKGDKGDTGTTVVGQVTIGQTASIIAIVVGIREITVPLAGTVVGARYAAYATSYKLNGGSSVSGRPSGYAIVDCVCNAVGQITISLNAPLLAIGASYAITCDVVRVTG